MRGVLYMENDKQKKLINDEDLMQATGGTQYDENINADILKSIIDESRQPDGSFYFCCQSCGEAVVGLNEQAFRNKLIAHFEREIEKLGNMDWWMPFDLRLR